ncbi:LLM class flavin-dependent oxidoreductase [Roseiarcaceae bacterium H3SJ34-1]|uniref:LLM class flavin-dependent oxidoreductase n=1 Tax=Terripilifer ovatus TaxID=3032367 RepID=UPI003AB95C72|nr:LLM class flavin-dependent oxidoreductase [Roseiarcaceae bacterium H3SJ34-1]
MSNGKRKQLRLGAFFHPTGNHVAAWLHPDSQIDAGMNFEHYADLARTAERAKFDLIFLADSPATRDGNLNALSRWPQYMALFEPTTLLSGLAAVTKHIGLVATATTTYNEPYNIARRFASLDLMSHGRAGWNVVTSSNISEAYNFNRTEHPKHDERYERALEFVEVCWGLWDSWDDDAFVRDRASSTYFHPEKMHHLNHKGRHFSVRGPLNVAPSPQRRPVLAQAGASNVGREFAAQIAEIIFTPLHTIEEAKAFGADIRGRMTKYGRDPNDVKIMPGLNAIVGRTDEEAREKFQQLQDMIHPAVGLQLLSTELGGVDLSPYPIDEPFPFHIFEGKLIAGSSGQRIYDRAKRENQTLRQAYLSYAGARGQRTLMGSPKTIADEMEAWLMADAVDGFLVQPSHLPGGLNEFADLVMPELVRRGIFRSEYEGSTLRENLGLHRPVSRYDTGSVAKRA